MKDIREKPSSFQNTTIVESHCTMISGLLEQHELICEKGRVNKSKVLMMKDKDMDRTYHTQDTR